MTDTSRRWLSVSVFFVALAIAAVGARPYAGSWNDGSRLATVESLVDRGTLVIDDSIFVCVPAKSPYAADDENSNRQGALDKLLIDGHYYSDKSPVPALVLAGVYEIWQSVTGTTAQAQPNQFCYVMTVVSSGLAYAVAVWCVFQTGMLLGLTLRSCLLLTGSLGLATVALTYTRHVNNHAMLLGVMAAIMLGLTQLAQARQEGRTPWLWLVGLGSLTGLGYTIDLGVGPVLVLATLGLVTYRCRSWRPVAVFLLASAPWAVLHHTVNYHVGGTFGPANANPEYLNWPGSPFGVANMTGGWAHGSIGHFLLYSLALLLGKRGFLFHDLPLLLAVAGLVGLLRRRVAERPELVYAACLCGGTWLMYAAASNNSSGACCSIRWFVPLLAPGYFVLAVLLREQSRLGRDFLILSGWGALLAGLMWWTGPWTQRLVPFYWPIALAALASWWRWSNWRGRAEPGVGNQPLPLREAA
jgi:hypothetical protein